MEAAQQLLELQTQVRQNAEVTKNTLNDLFSWEKDIKDKEKKIKSQFEDNKEKDNTNTAPVRSQNKTLDSKQLPVNTETTPATTVTNGLDKYDVLLSPSCEKQDGSKDPLDLKHNQANEIKDCGNKYVKSAEYTKAIEAYTQAIQMYECDAVYYSNRALCYLKLHRYEECIEDCERAIDIDRLAVKAYYRRMMANESLGNNMDALKDCSTVLMIEPKNIEAKRSLERINERLRKNVQTTEGPNFSSLRSNLVDILPIDKPAYKRSSKPLSRLAIADIVGPKKTKNYENLTISDDDIDKLFNSNCGYFEEIKEPLNNEKQYKVNAELEKSSLLQHDKEEQTPTTLHKQIDSNTVKERPLPPTPTSTAQFYSNWKELAPKQKYLFMKSIPIKQLGKILGAGFDSETLTDIINTLHDFYLREKDSSTAETLLEVSKNKQISILSLLLSNVERCILSDVLNSLKETNSVDAVSAEQIKKNFNLN